MSISISRVQIEKFCVLAMRVAPAKYVTNNRIDFNKLADAYIFQHALEEHADQIRTDLLEEIEAWYDVVWSGRTNFELSLVGN